MSWRSSLSSKGSVQFSEVSIQARDEVSGFGCQGGSTLSRLKPDTRHQVSQVRRQCSEGLGEFARFDVAPLAGGEFADGQGA